MVEYKIAIPDDDRNNLYGPFRDFLSNHFPEYAAITQVDHFQSKEEVEQAIREGRFDYDLVISDVNFGGDAQYNPRFREGLEILEIVKEYNKDLPVILVTGYAGSFGFDDVRRAYKIGKVDEWLKKSKTAEYVDFCLTCEKERDIVGAPICRNCGDPLEKFWYTLKKLLKPLFEKIKSDKEFKKKLSEIEKELSPPPLYEVVIRQSDVSKGPILATISTKEDTNMKINLELKPYIQGLIFLILAEEAGKKFLPPTIIARRVNQIRESEEPTPLSEEERKKFIKSGYFPACNLDGKKARDCSVFCDALELQEVCPFDYLYYPRYNLQRFNTENVRSHIKEIREMIFSKVQSQVGDKKLTRCVHSGTDKFCDSSDSIRDICKICRNDFILRIRGKGYGMSAKVRFTD